MIFFGRPVSTFPDHAPGRVLIKRTERPALRDSGYCGAGGDICFRLRWRTSLAECYVIERGPAEVPGGLAFSEFRGYESWQAVAISQSGRLALILANPVMIDAYQAGIPGNGQPFPDGAKMAKIHWDQKKSETAPAPTMVPDTLHDVDFMVKDSKRFADSGGWGYAEFEYDPTSETFRPGNLDDTPPQGNDAKCGVACHTIVKTRDYVFTEYGKR